MKNLFLLIFISLLSFKSDTVFICSGPKSVAYHSRKGCRGLNNCSTEIREVSFVYAQKIGRRACLICKPSVAFSSPKKSINQSNLKLYAYQNQ